MKTHYYRRNPEMLEKIITNDELVELECTEKFLGVKVGPERWEVIRYRDLPKGALCTNEDQPLTYKMMCDRRDWLKKIIERDKNHLIHVEKEIRDYEDRNQE